MDRVQSLKASVSSSAGTILEASKRITAMALVDASLALPRAQPVCEVALDKLALSPSNGGKFLYYRPSLKPSALLVLCHPSQGKSMCRTLASIWEEGLREVGVVVRRVDLQGEGHSLQSEEQLRAALTGKDPADSVPEEVRHLQGLVEECQFLIFVHPIFWFDVPSQLKAFQESVLSSGFAFRKLPGHWLLNRAAGVVEYVPVARSLMRRYASYGLLRDKTVFVTRTMGGPRSGLGIFGHEATSLESAFQFCGAHLGAVDVVAEIDDTSQADIESCVLPRLKRSIQAHCRGISAAIAAAAAASAVVAAGATSDQSQKQRRALLDSTRAPEIGEHGMEELTVS